MAKNPKLQVIIPYETLCELMEASQEVIKLRKDLNRLTKQHDALRNQFLELMEAFGDLKRYVSD